MKTKKHIKNYARYTTLKINSLMFYVGTYDTVIRVSKSLIYD